MYKMLKETEQWNHLKLHNLTEVVSEAKYLEYYRSSTENNEDQVFRQASKTMGHYSLGKVHQMGLF